jgi:hypothetical protein
MFTIAQEAKSEPVKNELVLFKELDVIGNLSCDNYGFFDDSHDPTRVKFN